MLIILGIGWDGRRHLAQWLQRGPGPHRKLCDWVEANIEEPFAFHRLPRAQHLNATNLIERLDREIKRRTLLVRFFPDEASCLRLVRALAVEIHGEWADANRYLDMGLLQAHRKAQTQAA